MTFDGFDVGVRRAGDRHGVEAREGVPVGVEGLLRETDWVSAPAPSSCREMLLHACRNAGFSPRLAHECGDLRAGL
ncbi:hypothetical protein ABZ934_13575 [Streptomyces sp. NPDC046557]|uniref:hypothetical protein n=1 Tax=Streptomyces sp. NPDC046557 TaxID=3155372 RepID=UPI0033DCC98B